MKKSLFVIIPTLIILVGGAVYIIYNNTDKEEEKTKQEINKEEQAKEFVFETAEGTVEFDAEQALTPRGFAGATNHIFYMKDNNLYYYVHEEDDELYAKGVEKIYYETDTSEEIVVNLKKGGQIVKNSDYLLYVKENEKIYTFETSYEPSTVKIVATKAITASGSAGASNNIFYIKDNNLYKYNHDGEDELLAEKVLDITFDIKKAEELIIEIDKNTKIIETNPYILYMKENEQIFTFITAYEPSIVRIVATKATNLGGFAGASNKIFYIKDNNLYKYVHEGEDELLVENALDVSFDIKKIEALLVKIDENSKIIKNSQYAKYIKEGEQIFTFETANVPSQVKIIAKEALTPRGFAGSSNHIFYLKDNNLYYYVHEGEDELYAIGVEKIYHESKQSEEVVVKLNKNSEIIKESSYLIYK